MNPEDLRQSLTELAANHRWAWDDRVRIVLDALPGADSIRHPAVVVRELSDEWLAAAVHDESLIARVAMLVAECGAQPPIEHPEVVYFSPEFGISERVAQYSGGLGILAGDHLKAASDLDVAIAGVGLFYRQGFFHQELHDGGQTERYEDQRPEDLGAVDTGHVVEVPVAERSVLARVWMLRVGRVPLVLLDTDHAGNSDHDRSITDRLYGGDRRHRLEQELILGVGGARAVEALGWSGALHHLNEGHAGFGLLELLERERRAEVRDLNSAIARVRPRVLFTTHTPVDAGIDRFDAGLIAEYLVPWVRSWGPAWGVDTAAVARLGADPHTDEFNMAALCLGLSARANGVSELHGRISRQLFAAVPGGSAIGSVTNGVHARSWVSDQRQSLFDEVLGTRWADGDPEAWSRVDEIGDDLLESQRPAQRRALDDALRERCGVSLAPEALVIGFARRFATYKRATLVLRDRDRLMRLLSDDERPVHLVFAGKAHPADGEGKALLREIVGFTTTPEARGRFSFIPDYDMAVARAMYAGCDVWLNTPVRPVEASGTSGEKAALNGALNCSVRDGWWAEMSDGYNGWDIAISDALETGRGDAAVRDDEEAAATLDRLFEIAAVFHDPLGSSSGSTRGGPSPQWYRRVRHMWRTLGPKVTAARMVRDYDRIFYTPMGESIRRAD